MRVKDAVGRFGEQLAAQRLTEAGMQILERNWRCREGELDIVAQDGHELVVVEVKTRSSDAFGVPAQAVTGAKAARIRTLTMLWLAGHRERSWPVIRFDVVAVTRRRDSVDVEHVRNAF